MARAVDDTAEEAAARAAALATLTRIHGGLRLLHGSLRAELPEQLMAVRFLRPSSTVLELGGNVGRNSCVIGRLLARSSDLVVVESDPVIAEQLTQNRDANHLAFHVVAAALSKRPLIQRDWITSPHDATTPVPEGWKAVPTITWAALRERFPKHAFDTLVADCEGALYYILLDEPTFLDGFRTVIMENDYQVAEHKTKVDEELRRRGFARVYVERGGWKSSPCPCAECFFECWRKK